MRVAQIIKSKKKLLEWLRHTTVLLCSVLALSGYVPESRISEQGKPSTELRVSESSSRVRTISYNTPDVACCHFFEGDANSILLHHKRIVVTRLKNNRRLVSYKDTKKILRTAYTRSNYDEVRPNS